MQHCRQVLLLRGEPEQRASRQNTRVVNPRLNGMACDCSATRTNGGLRLGAPASGGSAALLLAARLQAPRRLGAAAHCDRPPPLDRGRARQRATAACQLSLFGLAAGGAAPAQAGGDDRSKPAPCLQRGAGDRGRSMGPTLPGAFPIAPAPVHEVRSALRTLQNRTRSRAVTTRSRAGHATLCTRVWREGHGAAVTSKGIVEHSERYRGLASTRRSAAPVEPRLQHFLSRWDQLAPHRQ